MNILDFAVPEAFIIDLNADSKTAAIRAMVRGLINVAHLELQDEEDVVSEILKREELGTTGIGKGIAVPHAKHAAIDRPIGTFAIAKQGIDFASLDAEPVYVIFLLLSPGERPGEHLRALETVLRHLRNAYFRHFLAQAHSAAEIVELLQEADSYQFA